MPKTVSAIAEVAGMSLISPVTFFQIISLGVTTQKENGTCKFRDGRGYVEYPVSMDDSSQV